MLASTNCSISIEQIAREFSLLPTGQSPKNALPEIAPCDRKIGRAVSQKRFGWQPIQPALLADLDRASYFPSWSDKSAFRYSSSNLYFAA